MQFCWARWAKKSSRGTSLSNGSDLRKSIRWLLSMAVLASPASASALAGMVLALLFGALSACGAGVNVGTGPGCLGVLSETSCIPRKVMLVFSLGYANLGFLFNSPTLPMQICDSALTASEADGNYAKLGNLAYGLPSNTRLFGQRITFLPTSTFLDVDASLRANFSDQWPQLMLCRKAWIVMEKCSLLRWLFPTQIKTLDQGLPVFLPGNASSELILRYTLTSVWLLPITLTKTPFRAQQCFGTASIHAIHHYNKIWHLISWHL